MVPKLSQPEPLTDQHDLSPFSCGKPSLDQWLRTRALANQAKGFTAVRVVHVEKVVVGYYGLAPTAVVPTSLPRSIRTGQPPNPIPCLLLGQLAIDQNWAGRGIGAALTTHALGRCVKASTLIGGRALLVKAVDEDTRGYWLRWGFLPTHDDPFTLYRSIGDIAASIDV
jgi:GNAT superfamily N-acetyltransferase